MNSANLTREETAARAATITLRSVRVELDLVRAADPAMQTFGTTTTLAFTATTDHTWLDFLGGEVERVFVNGMIRPVEYDGARLVIRDLAASNLVIVQGRGTYSTSGEGLHRFVDPADGETYLYTQYEPADSRRVMACFEQPDLKARYTMVVDAPVDWHVLSNQRVRHRATHSAHQRVEFAPTQPVSSYLTAIAAGPYHCAVVEATAGEQRIELGVFCRASLAEHVETEQIVEVTRQGLEFFTTVFDRRYPWGKYDQIFVPEYNLGAMENPGLVTFTEAYITRGAATEAQRAARANTILHEMAHMWFGDLVTMRWWDDLWLKESFADYMGALASAEATRFTDAWVTFADRRKAWAYEQDQLPTTHPIVADIVDLEAAKLNFDGITYAKGAAVLKQLVAFVGEADFFAAVRGYFADHAFQNTTFEDLLRALERVSDRDVRAWSRAWLETSGVTTLTLELDDHGRRMLVQSDPRPHRLRVGLYDLRGGELRLRDRVEVDVTDERTLLEGADADLVLPNDGDLTYAKVRLDRRSRVSVERALSTMDDPLARGLVWSALWNATRDGEYSARRYLALVARHAPLESNIGLLTGVLANALFAVRHYVAASERDSQSSAWLATTREAVRAAKPASDSQLAWARAFAAASAFDDGAVDEVRAFLDSRGPEGLRLDADLRWLFVTALATTGHAAEGEIAAERSRDDTARGRTAALRALASRPDAAVRAAAWESAWDDAGLSNEQLDATIAGFRAGDRRDLTGNRDGDYFARIEAAWRSRSIEIARRLVLGLFPASDSLDGVDRWLADHPDAPPALLRLLLEQRDHLARDLRVRARQEQLDAGDEL